MNVLKDLRYGLSIAVALAVLNIGAASSCGQEESTVPPSAAPRDKPDMTSPPPSQEELFEKFTRTMTGARLTGSFTVVGRESGELTSEEYHIKSVRKTEMGDTWLFVARIKYGERDYSVPLPLDVKWAGDTPVITLTNVSFLGQGPFGARVVIHENKYAGTWSHGDHGGHLFGTIVPGAAEGVEVNKVENGKGEVDKKKNPDAGDESDK